MHCIRRFQTTHNQCTTNMVIVISPPPPPPPPKSTTSLPQKFAPMGQIIRLTCRTKLSEVTGTTPPPPSLHTNTHFSIAISVVINPFPFTANCSPRRHPRQESSPPAVRSPSPLPALLIMSNHHQQCGHHHHHQSDPQPHHESSPPAVLLVTLLPSQH